MYVYIYIYTYIHIYYALDTHTDHARISVRRKQVKQVKQGRTAYHTSLYRTPLSVS